MWKLNDEDNARLFTRGGGRDVEEVVAKRKVCDRNLNRMKKHPARISSLCFRGFGEGI